MRAHAITTTARVGARAFTRRTTAPRGIFALSLAVALFAATASTASADRVLGPWYCPPPATTPTTIEQVPGGCLDPFGSGPSFDFGDRQVGTTSPAQGFALGVFCLPEAACNDTLNPRISVSGDYAQTNNCPPTLSAIGPGQVQGCGITVTFTPTGTGPKNGTLSTGPGGPTAALTGSGVTTPTPPVLPTPMTLDVAFKYGGVGYVGVVRPNGEVIGTLLLTKKLKLRASTSNDSTLVARGDVKRTTKQLAAGEPMRFKAKLKQSKWKQLKQIKEEADAAKPVRLKAKIKVKATDEFGQTATDEYKLRFCLSARCTGVPSRDPSL